MLAGKFPTQLAGKTSADTARRCFQWKRLKRHESGKSTAEPISERNDAAPPARLKTGFLTKFQTDRRLDFRSIVQQNFGHWIPHGQVALSDDRIKELILDPDVRGAEAAAIAAIHIYSVYQRKTQDMIVNR